MEEPRGRKQQGEKDRQQNKQKANRVVGVRPEETF
jgi:hypothetical protein